MTPRHFPSLAFLAALLVVPFVAVPRLAADPPKVQQLRVQTIGDTTYFHVRLESPADLAGGPGLSVDDPFRGRGMFFADPLLMPRLVPQSGSARAVYRRMDNAELERQFGFPGGGPPGFDEKRFDKKDFEEKKFEEKKFDEKKFDEKKFDEKKFDEKKGNGGLNRQANMLEFVGKVTGKNKIAFLLLYPMEPEEKPQPKDKKNLPSLAEVLARRQRWAEVKIELDFAKVKELPTPPGGSVARDPKRPPANDDLEGLWAAAQALHFTFLESQTPEFGFYGLARESTIRKHRIPAFGGGGRFIGQGNFRGDPRFAGSSRLYEITTGAAAITESLALDRLRGSMVRDRIEDRIVPIANVRGIDIAEHPWQKMMAGKKPAAEPLARLVPHDNYYIHFKNIAKFLDAGDLLDQWGTTLMRSYEVHSKEYRLKERCERQLCLKSTGLARTFGPAVIKGIAVTGNDPYLREGSDLTVLFHLANVGLFKAAVEPFIREARKNFGPKLKEEKAEYQQIAIESYVTPLREVSLHRAFLDDVAVYSNSPTGIRRVIDAARGKLTSLADSLDFQYMRTIFRADDKEADGFVFLSDPFIRNLVGPALRIKERRRLEAMTSLQMVTHGAMFTAWETGKLPIDHGHILHTTGLKQEELFTPDGGGAFWDQDNKIAVSAIYNTQHFATPLIELPIDFVSPIEAREYENFRLQYLGLWRQFFDPIGMRLAINKDEVCWETYILPLVKNTQYNELRRVTGSSGLKFDPAVFSDKTLAQFLVHLSPEAFNFGGRQFGIQDLMIDIALRSWLGDWATIRLDDSAIYATLLEAYIRRELNPQGRHDFVDEIELALQIPLTVGVEIRNPMVFAGILATVRKEVHAVLPGAVEWAPMDPPYKGTSIVRIKSRPQAEAPGLIGGPIGRMPNFALYYALIDGGFYLSLREEPIKDLIDRSVARKEKGEKGRPQIEAAASLHLAPGAAVQAKDLLALYLEWEAHRRAQQNNHLLYALFHSQVASGADTSEVVEAAALQYLGYVPVSPDRAPFGYSSKYDEVSNQRHGSLRQPKLQPGVDADSPAGQLLQQLMSIRADLRFREDGVHTTVTLRRGGKK